MRADDTIGILFAQSSALYEVKRYAEAATRANEAARLAPNDPRPYQAWSRALQGAGQFADAARMADESIRRAPESSTGFRLRASALSSLAPLRPESEREWLNGEAVQSAREAVRLAPHDVDAHRALARGWLGLGTFSKPTAPCMRCSDWHRTARRRG